MLNKNNALLVYIEQSRYAMFTSPICSSFARTMKNPVFDCLTKLQRYFVGSLFWRRASKARSLNMPVLIVPTRKDYVLRLMDRFTFPEHPHSITDIQHNINQC